ncbi:penicillin-binding protein [Paenibacillus larvae subsp. larvae DSM 25719]|uniref:peptidoglycan D,D-transpeptidase FtsI family protein n=1 Tax=Paenibacillus larvae TaxID=1464 RepID=UPI0003DBBDC6|nr:penicillin-binding protein 2 [Paenibacillus larvae]ETK30181.1 penicillin-binding protein [Paenibacillus larvae subsp. larvae DSM 25719]
MNRHQSSWQSEQHSKRRCKKNPVLMYRSFLVLMGLCFLFAVLVMRLGWIQLLAARNLTSSGIDLIEQSVWQRQRGLVLDTGRGEITDRAGRTFTGRPVMALLVFPLRIDESKWEEPTQKLLKLLKIRQEDWKRFIKELKEPSFWTRHISDGSANNGFFPVELTKEQAEAVRESGLPHIKAIPYTRRYPALSLARQVIGFIGQNPQKLSALYPDQAREGKLDLKARIGGSGIEKAFEPWLRGIGQTSLSYFIDGKERPLQGLNMRVIAPETSYYPLQVRTTLDQPVQEIIEKEMDRLHIKMGSVVVLDASNADIFAMASRPNFNQEHVQPDQDGWKNHAVKAIAPGSVFKTVMAAASLEKEVVSPDETFFCRGDYGKYGFTCWNHAGHGELTLKEGFASSCNLVFAELSKRLSADEIDRTAQRMGLLKKVGWSGKTGIADREVSQVDGEEAGQLFAEGTQKEEEGVLMQTSIGQRDVKISPLQAANMIVTLLHHGEVRSPRLVQDIRFRDGTLREVFKPRVLKARRDGISFRTSKFLLESMREVVLKGTGKALRDAKWQLAGKSGTAQVRQAGKETVNQWFVGFGPYHHARYAVAVVVEGESPDAPNKAIPLFKKTMNILSDT